MTAKIRIILIEVVTTAILTGVAFLVWQQFNSTAAESGKPKSASESFAENAIAVTAIESSDELQLLPNKNEDCMLEIREREELQSLYLGEYQSTEAAESARTASAQSLAESDDPEHQLAAGLLQLRNTSTIRFSLFKSAFEANPLDPLTSNLYYQSCTQSNYSAHCNVDWLEQHFIEVDGSNSEAWSLIVGRRWRAGDESGALDAMRRAVAAADTNDYYAERVGVIKRGLAAAGFGNQAQQISAAIGYAYFVDIPLRGPIEACKASAPTDTQWMSLCVQLGEKVERESRMPDYYQMGLGLQRLMLRETGDTRGLAEVQRKIDEFREWVSSNSDRDFDPEFYSDVTMLNEYLDALETHGQFAAFERYFAFRELWRAERCEAAAIGAER